MGNPIQYQATVLRNGTFTVMSRVDQHENGVLITQAGLSAVSYTIYLLDKDWPDDPNMRTPVSGHEDVALTIGSVVFDTLQTGDPWNYSAEPTGYNFKHTIDVSTNLAFTIAGRYYLIKFKFTPVAGQVVYVDVVARCI